MDFVLNTLKLWWLEQPLWVYDGQITSGNKASEDNYNIPPDLHFVW